MTTDKFVMDNVSVTFAGKTAELGQGAVLNLSCNRLFDKAPKFTNLVIAINLEYDADIFGFMFHRFPVAVPFTWIATATNPQWIKGNFANQRDRMLVMLVKLKLKGTAEAEYKRFLETALQVEASENQETFDRAFGKVVKPIKPTLPAKP